MFSLLKIWYPVMTEIWVAVEDGYGLLGVTYKALVFAQKNASHTLLVLEWPQLANLHVMMDQQRNYTDLLRM